MVSYYADIGLQEAVNINNNNRDNVTPNHNDTSPGANTTENDVDTDTDTPGVPIPPPDSDPLIALAPDMPLPWFVTVMQTVHSFYSRGAPIPAVRTYVQCNEHNPALRMMITSTLIK